MDFQSTLTYTYLQVILLNSLVVEENHGNCFKKFINDLGNDVSVSLLNGYNLEKCGLTSLNGTVGFGPET